jgi:hypothetical protein
VFFERFCSGHGAQDFFTFHSVLHEKIRDLTRKQAEQEECVSDFADDLRKQERKFASTEKGLVEKLPLKNCQFAELVDLKRQLFELQRHYV